MSIRYTAGALQAVATGARITTGAASAGTTIPLDSSGGTPMYVYLSATAACHVRIDKTANTPAAVNTDLMVQVGEPVIISIPKGYTKIAAIQEAAAGVLMIQPLENA